MTRGHSTSKFHDKFAFKLKIKNIQKVHRKFFFSFELKLLRDCLEHQNLILNLFFCALNPRFVPKLIRILFLLCLLFNLLSPFRYINKKIKNLYKC